MKKIAIAVGLLGLVGTSLVAFTQQKEQELLLQQQSVTIVPSTSQVETLQKQLLVARKLEQKLVATPRAQRPQKAMSYLKTWSETSTQKGELSPDFALYYAARLEIIAEQHDKARKDLAALAGSEAMAPEAVHAFMEVATEEEGYQRDRTLGRLLPSSSFANAVRVTVKYADTRYSPIPKADRRVLIKIAEMLYNQKLYQEATVAYQEAVYNDFAPPFVVNFSVAYGEAHQNSWLSQSTAPLWLNAAQCQWQLGHHQMAANYMGKAFVFGSEAVKIAAIKRLDEWKANAATPPATAPAMNELDPDDLKQIAALYVEMNMHPRAIELLQRYGVAVGAEAKPLVAQYEKEWLRRVGDYCSATFEDKCFVFTQPAYRDEDAAKITVPPPCRPQALQYAAKTLGAMVEGKPEKAKVPAKK